jgi:hypothetical protein
VLALLLTLALVAAVVAVLRRLPSPPRADVGPRLRAAGRLLLAAGVAALVFITVAVASSGEGGVLFLLFLQVITLPPIIVAITSIRTGYRLSRGVVPSRVTAGVAAGFLVVCAGFWVFYWAHFEVSKGTPVLSSRGTIQVGAGLIATIGLSALVALVLIVTAPRIERATGWGYPPPAAAASPRWETAVTLISIAIVATLGTGLTLLGSASPRVEASGDDGSCRALRDVAGSDLGSLSHGLIEPPLLSGAKTLGAGIHEPGHNGDRIKPGDLVVRTYDSHPSLVVLQRLRHDSAKRMEAPARAAISRAGFTAQERANSGSSNGKVSYLSVPYSGRGISGDITYHHCDGDGYALITQELPPDQVGLCADSQHRDRCIAISAVSDGPMKLVTEAFATDGTRRQDPTFELRGGRLALVGEVTAHTPLFFMPEDVDNAFGGWQRVSAICDGKPCAFSPGDADQTATLVYRTGDVTATLALSDSGDGTHIALAIT